MRHNATRFHRALATMPYFNRIVTTNWDRYFEEFSGSTPFVYDSDVNFWESAERSVLKIHGSVDNLSSLVATTADYAECEQRLHEGPMGAILKQILSTKTCIFIGYSATDPDFLGVFNLIQTRLSKMSRTHYIVSPVLAVDDLKRLYDIGILPVATDGTFFLETVKAHMCNKFCYATDYSYDVVEEVSFILAEEHIAFCDSFNAADEPHLICATFYQDGFIHALERIVDLKKTGEYSDLHRLQARLAGYHAKIRSFSQKRNYSEVSYFEGYAAGLLLFLSANASDFNIADGVPIYFHPGVGPISTAVDYDRLVRQNPKVHKGSLQHCQRLVDRMGAVDGIVIQHQPWG